MTFQEAQAYLDSFMNFEQQLGRIPPAAFKLDRMRHLLETLGRPGRGLKIVHVAGTKGKGSVCAMTAEILSKAGHRVGLYTSPHIEHYRERIRVLSAAGDDKAVAQPSTEIFPDCISEQGLCGLLERARPWMDKASRESPHGRITFFEVFTGLALLYFQDQKVDIAVLETGLGGRLDATNAVDSLVAAVTPVSLEHTQILGDTIEKIAGEKAGIIKDVHQRVVLGIQPPDAARVLEARCRDYAIEPLRVGADITWQGRSTDLTGQTVDLRTRERNYPQLRISLLGYHQQINAATSIGIIEQLNKIGWRIPEAAVYEGLGAVRWPGRFEIFSEDPLIILDAAHNGASAAALRETLTEVLPGRRIVVVAGVSEDKDWPAIQDQMRRVAHKIILTKADHPRARTFQDAVDISTAVRGAMENLGGTDVMVVMGSVFVVAQARRYLLDRAQRRTPVV